MRSPVSVLLFCSFSTCETNSSTLWWFLTFEDLPILRHPVRYNWYLLLIASYIIKLIALSLKKKVHCSSPLYSLITLAVVAPLLLFPFIFFPLQWPSEIFKPWFLNKLVSNLYCAHHINYSHILWRSSHLYCNKIINTACSGHTCRQNVFALDHKWHFDVRIWLSFSLVQKKEVFSSAV